jgi:hypothetical protein
MTQVASSLAQFGVVALGEASYKAVARARLTVNPVTLGLDWMAIQFIESLALTRIASSHKNAS